MTTILVTGANGQLGKCLQDIAKNHSEIRWVFKTFAELNITSKKEIGKFFKEINFDYVINCAAYTAVDKAEKERAKAFLVNAEAVKYLAESCKANNTILIHISTDFVFDGNKTEPYLETDMPNPLSVYGVTKLQGENHIRQILQNYFIFRTSWLYSEHGHNFMKTMLKLAETRNEISVVSDQIGTPTYAGDLAEVVLNIITNHKMEYGLYHYSNGGEVSWCGFAKAIFELSGKDVKVYPITTIEYPTAAKRPRYSVLNTTKIEQQIGILDKGWKTSLEKVLNGFIGNVVK